MREFRYLRRRNYSSLAHMKQIFRLLFIVVLTLGAFVACETDNPAPAEVPMRDGVWEGLGNGRNGMIKLCIVVENNRITGIRILSQSESKFAHPAENEIINAVIQHNGTDGVDAITGATLTSNGMLEAITAAINASKGINQSSVRYTDTACDIVIVGAGGAGLSAAIEASSFGVNVIVLEKQGIIGGNTNSSTGGLNAAETLLQKQRGVEDSKQLFFDDTMTGGYMLNDPSLVRTLTDNAAEAVDWLTNEGADLSDLGKMAGSSVPRAHRPQNGAAIGPHLMSVLYKSAKAGGIEIRTGNKVKEIIAEDGCAKGVVVESGGYSYTIKADAVIIATGGFGANAQMIARFRPDLQNFNTSNHAGATGDAFSWVTPFGGAMTQMEQIQTHPTGEVNSHLLITEAVRGNGAILINKTGRRFANEMLTRDKLSEAILAQEGRQAYIFFDQSVRNSLEAITLYAQQGILIEADNLEQLAEQINVEPQVLEQTVTTYNHYQQEGEDKDFGRTQIDMPRSLTQAPYYAIAVEPVIHHTMGGLKINNQAQVLNAQGEAIPGLYAAGEVTGGVHGGNRLGGNAIADIVVYGRIAGKNAAAMVKRSVNFLRKEDGWKWY